MVDVDKSVVAKLKKGGKNFEVAVDCTAALELREGKKVDIHDLVVSEKIFSDSKRGLLASQNDLKSLFETNDPKEIITAIIMHGELQLTAEYKAKILDKKRKQIIAFIQQNGVDPRTSLPHPLQRIELAFEEAKIKIDEHKQVQKQVESIVKKLKLILPISFARKEIALKIPPVYASKAHVVLKQISTIKREEWGTDGSWFGVVEIPAGVQNELFDKVNSISHGEAEIKIIKIN